MIIHDYDGHDSDKGDNKEEEEAEEKKTTTMIRIINIYKHTKLSKSININQHQSKSININKTYSTMTW